MDNYMVTVIFSLFFLFFSLILRILNICKNQIIINIYFPFFLFSYQLFNGADSVMKRKTSLALVLRVIICGFVLVSFIGFVSAAEVVVQPLKIENRGLNQTNLSCPSPYDCLLPNEAIQKWGPEGFSQRDNVSCQVITVASEMKVPKYCYKQQSQQVAVTTTTPVPAPVQPPIEVVPAKIPAQPEPAQGIISGNALLIGGLVGLAAIGGLAYYGIRRSWGKSRWRAR